MFGLSFLNAGILLATLAALIPLLIHLFVKNKPKMVFFSSLRFLTEILEERRRRMTINQLILLILRMLIVLFIVLALAKPVLQLPFFDKSNYHPPTAVAFILDTSPSMDYIIDQKTQIQHGIDAIKDIRDEMNQQDISLLYTSDPLQNALKSAVIYGTLPDNLLANINFTYTPEPLERLVLSAQSELEKTKFLHKQIYVISDIPVADGLDRPAFDIPIKYISTFTDTFLVNIATEKVIIKKELIDSKLVRIAEFEVASYCPFILKDQIVRLNLNGTTISEKMIDFQPFEKKRDYFVINHENLEWNYGYVEVRNERFVPDNRNYFSFYSDPRPQIGVITNKGRLPKHIEVLADIFIGTQGDLITLSPEAVQFSDGERFHFIIFYLSTYSSRTLALIQEMQKKGIRSMFILPPDLDDFARNHFQDQYGLQITNRVGEGLSAITGYHQWHRIVGDFEFGSRIALMARPALNIAVVRGSIPLVNTDTTPLILENSDILVNIDLSVNQNFLSFPAFPIIIYRAFSWISKYDSAINEYFIGDRFHSEQGVLLSPDNERYDATMPGFRFNIPGVWAFTDNAGNVSYIAVNMADYEGESRMNVRYGGEVEEGNTQDILSQDKGNEIWKALLWCCLVFLAAEMVIVLIFQRQAEVRS